jgi:hypothetical protein
MNFMTPNQMDASHVANVKLASGINLLAGIWFFLSPWVYNAWHLRDAWNSWIVGFVIALFAIIRISSPGGTQFFSWVNLLLGIWAFISPWVYNYTGDTGRFVNSLCVGVIVFVLAISSLRSTPHTPLERPL